MTAAAAAAATNKRSLFTFRRVLALAAALAIASLFFLDRTPLIVSPSGHAFHPKLCVSSSTSSSSTSTSTSSSASTVSIVNLIGNSSCKELLDPAFAKELVSLPRQLRLHSGHVAVERLHRQLVSAVAGGWPLPFARRFTQVMLEHFTPQGEFLQPAPLQAKHSGHPTGWQFVNQAMLLIAEQGQGSFVACKFDKSLPASFKTRFLFSGTLDENAASSMPNLVLQLLRTVALLQAGHAYVSIHATMPGLSSQPGEVDTLFWLDLLQLLLVPLGVPMHLVVAPAAPIVPLSSQGNPPKIVVIGANMHMARNAAVAPFFLRGTAHTSSRGSSGMGVGSSKEAPSSNSSSSSTGSSSSIAFGRCSKGQPEPSCYGPEYVVFFDGVFFCSGDMVRLMEYPEDLVCGIQLAEFGAKPKQRRATARRHLLHQQQHQHQQHQEHLQQAQLQLHSKQHLRQLWHLVRPAQKAMPVAMVQFATATTAQQQQQHTWQQPQQHKQQLQSPVTPKFSTLQATTALPDSRLLGQQRRLQQAAVLGEGPMAQAAAASHEALKSDMPPEFYMKALHAEYDATRDIAGRPLTHYPPYFAHANSAEQAIAGLPVPVFCCWGGLAKLRAAPLAAGLRFRSAVGDECGASEVNLMCDDMRRVGFDRIILDPGVRTSSQLRTKQLFEQPRFPFFYYSKWETTEWFDIHPLLPLQFWNSSGTSGSGDGSNGNNSSAGVSWQPGSHETCCEQTTGGRAGRPSPADCRRIDSLTGVNYTSVFLQTCQGKQAAEGQVPLEPCW